jgi:ferrous iron transport protein A
MTLQEGKAGSRYLVKKLELPVSLERRLEALGLIEGSVVSVMRKKHRGAMIIKVRGTRFAVGWGISTHIQVSNIPQIQGGQR